MVPSGSRTKTWPAPLTSATYASALLGPGASVGDGVALGSAETTAVADGDTPLLEAPAPHAVVASAAVTARQPRSDNTRLGPVRGKFTLL